MIKLVKIYNKYDIHVDDTEKRGQAVIEQGGIQLTLIIKVVIY